MKLRGTQRTKEYRMEVPVGPGNYLLLSVASPNSRFLIPMAKRSGISQKIILR